MKIKKEYLILAGIFAIGAVVRIIQFDTPDLVMDTVVYSRLGKNLIEFGRYTFGENYNMGIFFPPGYPIFVGLMDLVFNDLFFSAKIVSFVSSGLSIFLSYLIGKELYDVRSGLFAALLFAVYPVIILLSVQGYADAPFIFLLLLSIYMFIRSLKVDRIFMYALLGVVFSITFLVRPEGLFILILPSLQLFGIFSNRFSFDKKYLPKISLIFLLFVLLISPYMLLLKDYTGKFTLSGKGNVSMILGEFGGDNKYHEIVNAPDNLYDRAAFSLNEDKTQLRAWGKEINFSLIDYVKKDPVAFAKKYQKNVLQEIQVLIKLLIPIMLPLFFAFFYRDLFTDKRRLIFILLPFIFFLIYPLFIIIEKQTLLVVVFLLVFASGGFSNAGSEISDMAAYYSADNSKFPVFLEKHIKTLIIVILMITSLSYLKYSRFQHFDSAHAKPEEHRMAGEYLNETVSHGYEELNVMARKPYVSYYSNSKFTMIPYANVTDVLNYAKLFDVDYIVVDRRSLSMWEHYDELMELHKHSSDVELFYNDDSERSIKLFKVKK